MAISPKVQQHQQQQMQQANGASTQQTFDKKFGEAAYNALKAKYPSLLEFIITFKVLESDLEEGSGLGTFIMAKGQEVVYIPVVIADGGVESCEMLYDKEEDTFEPLTTPIVKKLVNDNSLTDYSIMEKAPYVEDTRGLFQRLTRPPAVTNPVLGGSHDGVSQIPNDAKEKIVGYFQDNPTLLAKVASFYPVNTLAEKLASVPETEKVARDIPSVISIDDLTKEASAALSKEQKNQALQDGYIIFKHAEDTPDVVGTSNLARDLVNNMGLTELGGSENTPVLMGTGYVFFLGDNEVKGIKCLVSGDRVFTKDGYTPLDKDHSLVLGGFTEGITEADLIEFGGQTPGAVKIPAARGGRHEVSSKNYSAHLDFFFPLKNGQFKRYGQEDGTDLHKGDGEKRKFDDAVYINGYGLTFGFSNIIDYGCIDTRQQDSKSDWKFERPGTVLFPKNSYVLTSPREDTPFITNLTTLYKLIDKSATKLKLVNDGAGVTLKDTSSEKTASFRKTADLVSHLVDQYSFDKKAVDKLLSDKEVLVLKKEAFTQPAMQEAPLQEEQNPQGMYAHQEHLPQQTQHMPGYGDFEPDAMGAAAELGDQEIMDTGILASVAGDEDMKVILVDMLPEFMNTNTKLGQTILLTSLNKEELEDFYGREEYQGLLGNLRKVFKTLGEIISDLRQYINMQ